MSKGLPRSLARGSRQRQELVKKRITFDETITITDPGGAAGYGTVTLYPLPEGQILFLGAQANVTLTKQDANIGDTFAGDYALGTASATDSTLDGNEVNLAPSTAYGPASSGVDTGPLASTASEGGLVLDNTGGSASLKLNMLVDDADITSDGDVRVQGELFLVYTVLGDD